MSNSQGTDLARLALFRENGYTNDGTPYAPSAAFQFRNFSKLPNQQTMYIAGGFGKTKAANSDGYFHAYTRGFDGDKYMTYDELKRAHQREGKALNIGGKNWLPGYQGSKMCGVGSRIGCFEKLTAFDPANRVQPARKEGKNFYTNPGKKGTGSGYLDVTINKYPNWTPGQTAEAARELMLSALKRDHAGKVIGRNPFIGTSRSGDLFEQNPFRLGDPLAPGLGPNAVTFREAQPKLNVAGTFWPSSKPKVDGGCKAGTLNKFPDYTHEKYMDQNKIMLQLYGRGIANLPDKSQWRPNSPCYNEMPNHSLLNKVVRNGINSKNRKNVLSLWNGKKTINA